MSSQILLINDVADVKVFHLAFCTMCDTTTPMPFASSDERNTWAAQHLGGTGHRSTFKTEIRIVTP